MTSLVLSNFSISKGGPIKNKPCLCLTANFGLQLFSFKIDTLPTTKLTHNEAFKGIMLLCCIMAIFKGFEVVTIPKFGHWPEVHNEITSACAYTYGPFSGPSCVIINQDHQFVGSDNGFFWWTHPKIHELIRKLWYYFWIWLVLFNYPQLRSKKPVDVINYCDEWCCYYCSSDSVKFWTSAIFSPPFMSHKSTCRCCWHEGWSWILYKEIGTTTSLNSCMVWDGPVELQLYTTMFLCMNMQIPFGVSFFGNSVICPFLTRRGCRRTNLQTGATINRCKVGQISWLHDDV